MKNPLFIATLGVLLNVACGFLPNQHSSSSRTGPSFPPLPALSDPCPSVDDLRQQLRTTPTESAFAILFRAGEQCGRQHELATLIGIGTQLQRDHALVFLDGAAHTHPFDPERVKDSLQMVTRDVPLEYRTLFLKGVALHQALAHADQPQQMVDFAHTFGRETGEPIPLDGIRVGLQRKLGEDLGNAVATALQYPAVYHRPLLEELGWRATVHDNPETVLKRKATQSISTPKRCIYMRGAIRGWTLRQPLSNTDDWKALHQSVGPALHTCPTEGHMGLAWAFIDRFQDQPAVLEAANLFQSASGDDGIQRPLRSLWPIRTQVNVWDEMN